jgi:hypothetical protein
MHPKIQEFQRLSAKKQQKIVQLCEHLQLAAEIEDAIILTRLEFSDESNSETELLLLDIELATRYERLGIIEVKIQTIQQEIDVIKMYLHNL